MNRWGWASAKMMWADNRLLRALGLLMAIVGICFVGMVVGAWVLVELTTKKKWFGAKSASR